MSFYLPQFALFTFENMSKKTLIKIFFMTHLFGTQRSPEIYQGAALLVVNKGSNSLYRGRSKCKINMVFKAATEEKKMTDNGESIMKQSALADLSIDKLADKKDKYSHYDFSMLHLVLYEIYGAHLLHHLDTFCQI